MGNGICLVCGDPEEIYAKGRCRKCYNREYMKERFGK